MKEIIARGAPFTKEVWTRDKAKKVFKDMGEDYKVELIDAIPEGEELKIYAQGDWFDLCRGPHMPVHGKGRRRVQAAEHCRGLLARRLQQSDAPAHLRYGLGIGEGPERLPRDARGGGESATTADWAAKWTSITSRRKRRDRCSGTPKGWSMFQALINYMRRRQDAAGYVEVNSPDMMDKGLWEKSGHWEKFGENMFTTRHAR